MQFPAQLQKLLLQRAHLDSQLPRKTEKRKVIGNCVLCWRWCSHLSHFHSIHKLGEIKSFIYGLANKNGWRKPASHSKNAILAIKP